MSTESNLQNYVQWLCVESHDVEIEDRDGTHIRVEKYQEGRTYYFHEDSGPDGLSDCWMMCVDLNDFPVTINCRPQGEE